jgi:RND family efflux transporter MFP subunit
MLRLGRLAAALVCLAWSALSHAEDAAKSPATPPATPAEAKPLGDPAALKPETLPAADKADKTEKTDQALEAPPDPVMAELGNIRGVVKPQYEAELSSEITARILSLPYKEGQRFRRGDTLIRFDCALYNAELASARAEHEAQEKTHKNNLELAKLDAVGKLDVDVSGSKVKKAAADMNVARVKVARCIARAPYDGRVVKLEVNEHEAVAPDQKLMRILDDRQLKIELIVPSKWLTWLKVGTGFQFKVDETGLSHPAKVTELGAAVDPVSQTIRLQGMLSAAAPGVLAGMSGTASFAVPK